MIEAAVIVAEVLIPPPEFERPPEVQVITRHFPAAHADQVCRIYPELANTRGGEFGACALPGEKVCTVDAVASRHEARSATPRWRATNSLTATAGAMTEPAQKGAA